MTDTIAGKFFQAGLRLPGPRQDDEAPVWANASTLLIVDVGHDLGVADAPVRTLDTRSNSYSSKRAGRRC
jgi:hypothetical protein